MLSGLEPMAETLDSCGIFFDFLASRLDGFKLGF
jgi:hypothetical protein